MIKYLYEKMPKMRKSSRRRDDNLSLLRRKIARSENAKQDRICKRPSGKMVAFACDRYSDSGIYIDVVFKKQIPDIVKNDLQVFNVWHCAFGDAVFAWHYLLYRDDVIRRCIFIGVRR